MSAILHRNLKTALPVAVGGDGAYLIDSEGKRYLDASGGAAVSCLGHNHPRVIAAIREQLGKLEFVHSSFFTNEPAEKLAEKLIALAPRGFGKGRVAFLGSGSESVEAALKLARQYHVERGDVGRTEFISREMSYHGNSLGALAVGGHKGRRAMYQPMLMRGTNVSACYAYRLKRDDESEEQFSQRLADELEQAIQQLGPDKVAAFIAEPVSGATLGSVPPTTGYFQRIREVCDRHGVLLIADEVMCGMGRTGSFFAMDDEGVTPDIITIAKGLGAGFQPIGAVMASQKVVDAIYDHSGLLANGHTYMSHAVACAGALAVLDVIEQDGLLDKVRTQGAKLEQKLRDAFGGHPNVGDIRGRGLFWTLELVQDRATKTPFDAALNLAAKIKDGARDRGLICYPSGGTADGRNGDHVLFAPPFIVTDAQLDEIVEKLGDTLAAVLPAQA